MITFDRYRSININLDRYRLILIIAMIGLLSSCAMYTVDYSVETLDADGNVTTRTSAKGRAFVANTSDEVSFQLTSNGDAKEIQFGKIGTSGADQIEALRVVVDRLACAENPAAFVLLQ